MGIDFGNTTAKCDVDANPQARNCVIPFLMKVSEGQTISMDEKSYNCAGGATVCCFGEDFAQWNPTITKLLSLIMPYFRWADLSRDLNKSCLTTHSWRAIEKCGCEV